MHNGFGLRAAGIPRTETKMTAHSSITNADDQRLVDYISAAGNRVVLAAPGISDVVAAALSVAWRRLGGEAVTVILDVDPEVCRLGYGTLEAVEKVRVTAAEVNSLVCHHPGLRIGLLVADDRMLVYSPTPQLIEAGSDAPIRPNSIEVGRPPPQIADDLGLGPRGVKDRRIGLDPVEPDRIKAVREDLLAAPPVKFDLARRVRVFTSRFQFVELEMTGCFVSRKKVPIPSRLIGLARHGHVEDQFHAHFDLIHGDELKVEDGQRVITEQSLRDRRRDVENRFVTTIPGYGSVILRANKDGFVKAVEELRTDVEKFSKGIRVQLDGHIKRNREVLVKALLPAVRQNPPYEYTKSLGPQPPADALAQRLERDIESAIGTVDGVVHEMRVNVIYKDVAYESLVDDKFLALVRKAMPEVKFLHDEHEAVQGMLFPGSQTE